MNPSPAAPESFALPGRNDHHRFFIDPATGKLYPLVQGGEGEGAAPGAATAADVAALQAQIDAAAKAAATKATNDAAADLAAKLGGRTIDQVLADAQAKSDADTAKLDDLQKAQARITELEGQVADLEGKVTAAGDGTNELLLQVLVDAELTRAGVPAAAIADVRPMVQVTDGSDFANITAAVEGLKTRLPGVFTANTDDGKGGSFDTGGAPAGGQPAKSAIEKGREKARAARDAQTKPASGVLAGLAPTA